MNSRNFRSGLRRAHSATAAILLPGAVMMGCLSRPIETVETRSTWGIVEIVPNSGVNKIDLVLAIDNSASMADKQQILAKAVPDLVKRLVNPPCIDDVGTPLADDVQPSGPEQDCPSGSRREFMPVLDIHIGIVSSSLGGHGGSHCPDVGQSATCGGPVSKNDHGHLVAREDACMENGTLSTYENNGFLAWDPAKKLSPPGESDLDALAPALAEMVQGTGQQGCGYESQLESIYRFLVDPEPYKTIDASSGRIEVSGIDEDLLSQRAAFLRPDSMVAILMLSDENDCSIRETGQYFRASDTQALPAARAVCAENPNDPCCTSCGVVAPANCPADPTCFNENGGVRMLSAAEDPVNLRCFDQKRRFGIDFLYPTDRYVDAFSQTTIYNRRGELVDNPLFPKADPAQGLVSPRTPNLVFFAGIVGVPWQDIARDPLNLSQGFKSASQMKTDGTWDIILGNSEKNTLPLDPLMRESTSPRAGKHPITGQPTDMDPSSPLDNSINGQEWNTGGDDLQYACIFDLPQPISCGIDATCECSSANAAAGNPLCDASQPNLLVRAKAYPGLRQLSVLQGLGDQGIVASVCPAQSADPTSADFGYRQAIGALVDKLKTRIDGPCMPRTLVPNETDRVNCLMLEARKTSANECSCEGKAREDVTAERQSAVQLAQQRLPGPGWDCFCEIPQLEGEELMACQNDLSDTPVTASGEAADGYCYIDATTEPAVGNPVHVATCSENERRRIRVVGDAKPAPDATLVVICSGEF